MGDNNGRLHLKYEWDLNLETQTSISPYAVAFYLVSGVRFHATGLAKIMIDFTKTYMSKKDSIHFNIVYRFADRGVNRLLFLGSGLMPASTEAGGEPDENRRNGA
ncbi:hypothetical protein NMY22_g11881 [Coprinellus aureogranulatus]|nr:hypothetical protein NMY22_g11881 [Coprinellus aureogranulatus]